MQESKPEVVCHPYEQIGGKFSKYIKSSKPVSVSRRIQHTTWKIFLLFSLQICFDILCISFSQGTICIKYQTLVSGKIVKNFQI